MQHLKEAERLRDDWWFRQIKILKYRTKNKVYQNRQEWSFVPFYANKCIFVHIPKAAGISVAQSLFSIRGGGHETIAFYKSVFSHKDFDQFFKFTFVRHPVDRLFSAYNYLKNGGFGINDRNWSEQNILQFHDFDHFVREWLSESNILTYIHFKPQCHFLKIDNKNLEIDFIGRYESLEKDFQTIAKRIGLKKDLLFLNAGSVNETMSKKISSESVNHIKKIYAEDFESFGYK